MWHAGYLSPGCLDITIVPRHSGKEHHFDCSDGKTYILPADRCITLDERNLVLGVGGTLDYQKDRFHYVCGTHPSHPDELVRLVEEDDFDSMWTCQVYQQCSDEKVHMAPTDTHIMVDESDLLPLLSLCTTKSCVSRKVAARQPVVQKAAARAVHSGIQTDVIVLSFGIKLFRMEKQLGDLLSYLLQKSVTIDAVLDATMDAEVPTATHDALRAHFNKQGVNDCGKKAVMNVMSPGVKVERQTVVNAEVKCDSNMIAQFGDDVHGSSVSDGLYAAGGTCVTGRGSTLHFVAQLLYGQSGCVKDLDTIRKRLASLVPANFPSKTETGGKRGRSDLSDQVEHLRALGNADDLKDVTKVVVHITKDRTNHFVAMQRVRLLDDSSSASSASPQWVLLDSAGIV